MGPARALIVRPGVAQWRGRVPGSGGRGIGLWGAGLRGVGWLVLRAWRLRAWGIPRWLLAQFNSVAPRLGSSWIGHRVATIVNAERGRFDLWRPRVRLARS